MSPAPECQNNLMGAEVGATNSGSDRVTVVLVHGAVQIGSWVTGLFVAPAQRYEVDGVAYETVSYHRAGGVDGRQIYIVQVAPAI